ncbi:uncharacterized protein F5891DRAFT_1183784 [Suillus fuscotomentosus]|uniref:BTB domain-containing protein n=1 Tax=Suillus fuscotomentosus TaxID=1912939 RepID=A0AAD4EF28_9AGAM|nr:uncharacterized protein F5891DRAFT_1183784 [Suillus fuscotomentosus]KAG1905078.1 hypothetical protein F5891DRAFT_1183784 [Suillus fuscotomentosus]
MSRDDARIHGLLRKSLVGELFDIQFDLFSARSKRTGNVTKPQALFANHEALASSSEYFASLLSEKTLNDPTLIELQDHHTCAGGISLSEYGYASDSDLDEEGEGEGEGGKIDEIVKDKRMFQTASNLNLTTKAAQRVVLSRRVFVTDTAFNTWNALLYYLYTDEILFAPSRSQGTKIARHCSLDGPPPCSPKSMYRLACKIKHDKLQAKALAAIRLSSTVYQ